MNTTQAHDHAQPGEVYVTLPSAGVPFPAVIEDERWNGFAQPRFSRAAAEAIGAWLNDHDDAGPVIAGFDGDVFTLSGPTAGRAERIHPDADDRYPIGAGTWEWELTTSRADIQAEEALLGDADRLIPETGEILVTMKVTGDDPAFPGLPDAVSGWSRAGTPRFRPEVAAVVVAWLNACGRQHPGGTVAYWEDGAICLLDPLAATQDGYVPSRILQDEDARYAIGAGFEWERAES